MRSKLPVFPGPRTARGAVLAVLLSNADQAGAEPLRGRITLAAIIRALKRKYNWPIRTVSFPSNSAEGYPTWATVYSLPRDVVSVMMNERGREWLKASRIDQGF